MMHQRKSRTHMNSPFKLALLSLLAVLTCAVASDRQRVLVLTDISNEPDDEESMVRFLVYANEYEVEG